MKTLKTHVVSDAEGLSATAYGLIGHAFEISMDRLRALASWEYDLYVLLLKEWRNHGDDPREQGRIERTLREIVVKTPVSVVPLDPGPKEPLSGERKKLVAFIGKKLKRERERSGLTQQQLAEKAGLRQSHICRLENCDHTPTRITLDKIARALGIDPRKFDPLEV